jgi:hypothetical protein
MHKLPSFQVLADVLFVLVDVLIVLADVLLGCKYSGKGAVGRVSLDGIVSSREQRRAGSGE